MTLPDNKWLGSANLAEILLASGSVVRQALLRNAGIDIGVVSHDIDERRVALEATGGWQGVALHLAEQKAMSASASHKQAFVIGADQTLELDGQVLNKPADLAEARNQLRYLSNKQHQLHSAFAVAQSGQIVAGGIHTATLTMRALSDLEIDWYLGQISPLATTSVGAYQLEGLGVRLFSDIDGDYFTILGLPMLPLLAELRRLGAITP